MDNVSFASESTRICPRLISLATSDQSDTYKYLLTVLLILLCCFIILSNFTLIIVMCRKKKSLTVFDRLFILLSSCDIIVGVIVIPMKLYLLHGNTPVTCLDVFIIVLLHVAASTMSGLVICLITNDRYFLITQRRLYDGFMTKNNIIITGFLL